MGVFSIIILMILFTKCQGNTYLLFQKEEEKVVTIPFQCEDGLWQIDKNNNNIMDYNCNSTVNKTCGDYFTFSDDCKKKCIITLKRPSSGIIGCVRSFNSTFIYPFNLSSDQVDSFILAFTEPELKIAGLDFERKTTVIKQTGESVDLKCNVKINGSYSNKHFSVYWIKVTNNKSTCLYSFSVGEYGVREYNKHCPNDEDLLKRMSNSSIYETNLVSHNLKINNVTHSDSGEYVCAFYVISNDNNWYGNMISNITVTVKDNGESDDNNSKKDKTPSNNTFIPYVVGAFMLFCLFAAVIIMWKNIKTFQAKHRTLSMKSDEDGEETLDCSLYAVGQGEEGPQSRPVESEADGQADPLYSVIMTGPEN